MRRTLPSKRSVATEVYPYPPLYIDIYRVLKVPDAMVLT